MPDNAQPAQLRVDVQDPQVEIDRLRERVRILEAEREAALQDRQRALDERDRHRGFRRARQRELDTASARIAELESYEDEYSGP